PSERRAVLLAHNFLPVERQVLERLTETAYRRQEPIHAAAVVLVGAAKLSPQEILFRGDDGEIGEREKRDTNEIEPERSVHDGKARDNQNVAEIQRVPGMRGDPFLHERVGVNPSVPSASRDVGETDHGDSEQLTGQGNREADDIKPAIELPVAVNYQRPRTESQREEDGGKHQISSPEEEVPDADQHD